MSNMRIEFSIASLDYTKIYCHEATHFLSLPIVTNELSDGRDRNLKNDLSRIRNNGVWQLGSQSGAETFSVAVIIGRVYIKSCQTLRNNGFSFVQIPSVSNV